MSGATGNDALARWRARLPPEGVVTGSAISEQVPSREGLRREVTALLRPRDVAEVQDIVRIAADCGHALHPISTGCNWGMGSALPVRGGCAILHLGGLNRIREISAEGLYATVEAGVTQGQLTDELLARDLPLRLNVTGSARHSSLLGNALERGIGYFQSRAGALAGLEVVLASGEILRTGFTAFAGHRNGWLYGQGLGPDLGALFSQSNFGVVTAAGFRLMPRPEAEAVLLVSTRKGVSLETFLDACIRLRRQEVFASILHLANGERSRITLEPLLFDEWRAAEPSADPAELLARCRAWLARQPSAEWNAVCALGGTPARVRASVEDVRRNLGPLAVIRAFTPAKLAGTERFLSRCAWSPPLERQRRFLRAVSPLLGLAFAKPTDAPLRALDWQSDPQHGGRPSGGVLYTLPLYPANARETLPALARLEALGRREGFPLSATLNLIDTQTMEGVLSIAFDAADAGECARAHACIRLLEEQSIRDGFPPYRTGIDRMDLADPGDPVRAELLRGLKRLMDPGALLAPGRYEPQGADFTSSQALV